MGWAIATTRRENRRRDLWTSRIARLIFAWNILGFAVLTLGALLLSELREQLIQAKIDSLSTQGELIANVLADTATIGEPIPELQEDHAVQVLSRLMLPAATRLRLFTPDGHVVADSNVLADRIIERPLGPARKDAKRDEGDWLAARLTPWRPGRTLLQELAIAKNGDVATGQRTNDSGKRVVSVSLPIQHVQAVLAVLTLESEDVDEILSAERRSMLPFIVGAGAISLLFSALLALVIAKPLRALAHAADQVRESGGTRLVLPNESRRKDEIGDLAQALERMTGALADRIDANERFAGDVSHEIKNPLTSIRSAVETAKSVNDDGARQKLLNIIQADVLRLDRLITDITRSSRLEAETARGGQEPVDMGRLLTEIAETYSATAGAQDANVMFEGPPPPGAYVLGQEGPLGQVFRNLIDNARSFSPPGGTVKISLHLLLRRDGRWLQAKVEDQGPGIPADNLEAIFRRFYTDRPKGAAFGRNSGLGLSIARQIVEAHRGRIWAENIGQNANAPKDPASPGNRGARLIVELPAAKEQTR
jgi:two-component system, OmpR family, sensor histidine kinase ChvG